MSDFDPFTTKVGNVYDSSGRRIGSIRSNEVPAGTSFLIGVAAVVTLIIVVVYGVKWGLQSLGNLMSHGEFTTDSFGAEVRNHLDNPNYFTDLAGAAKMTLATSNVSIVTRPSGTGTYSTANADFVSPTVAERTIRFRSRHRSYS